MKGARRVTARPVSEPLEPRTLLSAGPRVIFSSMRPGAEVYTSDSWDEVGVHFDAPVKPFGLDDFRFERLGVPNAPEVRIVAARFDNEPNEIVVRFSGHNVPGSYALTFLSGDGHLEGTDGADVDGDMPPEGTLPSGDGEAGGDFVLQFTTVSDGPDMIAPKQLVAWPLSSAEIALQWYADIYYANYDTGSYQVERATGDGEFQVLFVGHDFEKGTNGYQDKTAVLGEQYRYRVRALGYYNDQRVVSTPSNVAVASVLPPDLSVPVSSLLATRPGSRPDWLTDVGGTVFFTLSDGPNLMTGGELWTTDGTTAGTRMLFGGRARNLFNANGTLYFSGFEPETGYELWKSDGTPEGTVRVADANPGGADSNPRMLGVVGGQLVFAVQRAGYSPDEVEHELWKTDGTAEGTVRFTDALAYTQDLPEFYIGLPQWAPSGYRHLNGTVAGGYLYFRGDTGAPNSSLWRTDGTADGTRRVTGLRDDADPAWLTDFNGKLYFAASVATSETGYPPPRALFTVDDGSGGTAPTARLVYRPGTSRGFGHLAYLTDIGGALMFSSDTQNLGHQLYRSDGTTAGTSMVGRVNLTISGPSQYNIVDSGPTTFFIGNDFPPSLWKTDGTSAGTSVVRRYDFTYEMPNRSPSFLLAAGGGHAVYSEGNDLWYTDGTLTGTRKVAPVGVEVSGETGASGFSGRAAIVSGDKVYFSTKLPDGGRELRVASLTPPSAPDGLTASPAEPPPAPLVAAAAAATAAATPTGTRLIWNDRSSNETGFVIERSARADFGTIGKLFYPAANSTDFVDTSTEPGVTYYYRARAVNAGGASAYSNSSAPAYPKVTGVYVAGGTWDDAFKSRLETDHLGNARYGLSIFGPGDPASPLPVQSGVVPWVSVDRVTVQVDPATPLSPQDVDRLTAAIAGNSVFTGFTYDAEANTATWTAAPGTLDGPVDITFDLGLPEAGPLQYRLNVLPGDATRDRAVNALDLGAVKRALNTTAGGTGYNPFADVTADGRINALDLGVVKQRLNRRLDPAAPVPFAVPLLGASATTLWKSDSPSDDLGRSVPVLT